MNAKIGIKCQNFYDRYKMIKNFKKGKNVYKVKNMDGLCSVKFYLLAKNQEFLNNLCNII